MAEDIDTGQRLSVVIPHGKLGLQFQQKRGIDDRSFLEVTSCKRGSTLEHLNLVGDILIAIDEHNVKDWALCQVNELLSSRSNRYQRTLVVLRSSKTNEKSASCTEIPEEQQQRHQNELFPPTVFLDAIYQNGIRVLDNNNSMLIDQNWSNVNLSNYFASLHDVKKVVPSSFSGIYPYNDAMAMKNKRGIRSLPALQNDEAKLWIHKHAATSATQTMFPMECVRLLGTISRTVEETTSPDNKKHGPFLDKTWLRTTKKKIPMLKKMPTKFKVKKITKAQAKNEAREEFNRDGNTRYNAEEIDDRASEILQQWDSMYQKGMKRAGWIETGEIHPSALNDPNNVSIKDLLHWMKQKRPGTKIVDSHENARQSLYNGLRHIRTNTRKVLESLLVLSDPRGLYDIPLIVPVAVVNLVKTCKVTKKVACQGDQHSPEERAPKTSKVTVMRRTWEICIGVYANRLLPEVFSCHDLHVVMSALDADSYRLTEPLHLPPMREITDPVFQSCPYPAVVVTDEHQAGNTNFNDDDGEEKKSEDLVDATILDSTRDETTISAFTVKGLLKLLENKGNDISKTWPTIERIIGKYLKVSLMLHQVHGICWMYQMESLEGFGINSILWEEREFFDGGKYYYSPAVGQIRIGSKPPIMKGGILADEMGLGKTIEVLGLVVATLDELKKQAEEHNSGVSSNRLSITHATLIIVPPALVGQWLAEIKKITGDTLAVQFFDFRSAAFIDKSTKNGDPDIVLTTYAALERASSSRELSSRHWGRVVLDEMQEIRSSTTTIAKNCEQLDCDRRWMLSGTPLFEGIDDFRGELNFLRLEPYAASNEDGFFDFSITNHWQQRSLHGLETLLVLGMLILRRSKSMTLCGSNLPLLALKPLTVEFIPIPQTPSERALYCFMEAVVSRELHAVEDSARNESSRDASSRYMCLRLLREICMSPVLLNGGVGVSSQLTTLNNLMVRNHRREVGGHNKLNETTSVLSCDEAIRFLTQIQEDANVGDEFVSDITMGGSGGVSQRNHAMVSAEVQYNEAESNVLKAKKDCKIARTKKARALWHLALERITTGVLSFGTRSCVNPRFLSLWKWRFLVTKLLGNGCSKSSLPTLLVRGWRPSVSFLDHGLSQARPDFAWAHKHCLQLKAIPKEVTVDELQCAISFGLLQTNSDSVKVIPVCSSSESPLWRAYVILSAGTEENRIMQQSRNVDGLSLQCKKKIAHIEEAISKAATQLDEASAEHKVYPCSANQQKVIQARKAHKKAKKGLRIVNQDDSDRGHVLISRPPKNRPPLQPLSCQQLFDRSRQLIEELNTQILNNLQTIQKGEKKMKALQQALVNNVSTEVQAMSAFETLEALANNNSDRTRCPICLCPLGTNGQETSNGEPVAMTRCGHLFCNGCLDSYIKERQSQNLNTACPNCRKPFEVSRVVRVDPKRTTDKEEEEKRRQDAKKIIQRASLMLETSNGQLDRSLWEQLYFSIDLPLGVDRSAHGQFTAIPRDVLTHLRAATGMPVHCRSNDYPPKRDDQLFGFSSKIRALLEDLPQDERSVVFSSSKQTVKHLVAVLEHRRIGCRALYSGQKVGETGNAVKEWESVAMNSNNEEIIPVPVLLIQAGAAASGLTLTAASKMFFMEPFIRQEEEQQAYARCHRYGQKKEVICKCYYVPVSVESRLLEWRKRAVGMTTDGEGVDTGEALMNKEETTVIYSSLRTTTVNDEDDDDDEMEGITTSPDDSNFDDSDHNQTKFLLGLTDEKKETASTFVEE